MRFWLFLSAVLLMAFRPDEGRAQAIQLELRDVSLEDALQELRMQAGIDIVFARRLVEGRAVSCRYSGAEADLALACLLEGSGLQAERVRRRQYVLVAARSVDEAPDAPRSMLAGFVTDAETGDVLPGAHVYLPELQAGTVTNNAGYFAVAALPRRAYSVRVSYLGYQPLVTELWADTAAVRLHLQPVMLQAADIVVEGDRNDRVDLSTVPGVVAVPISQLERLPSFPGEHDLFQVLQWFPGVQKAGEINGALVVRGGEPDQNLYLLDGAPIYHPWHAFSLISTFQTETLRDIRLYRGAFPAEHGGRLAAVLDAQMKDGTRAVPRAVAALSVLSGRFLIEAPVTRNSSFMVSGRRSYLDKIIGREHPVEGSDGRRDTLLTGYYFYDMSAKYLYRSGNRHRLSASYYRGGDDLDLRLPFDLSLDFSSWLRPVDLFFEIDQDWQNRLLSLRYEYLYSRRLFLTATAYGSGYRAVEAAYLQPTSSAELASDYRVRLYDLGGHVELDYYHSMAHQLQLGLQVVERRFLSTLDAIVRRSPAAVDTLSQRSRSHAAEMIVYLQDTWQPAPRWRVQPGVRASFFGDGRYGSVDPSLNVQYALLPEALVVRGGVGTQVQYLHRLRDRYAFMYDLVSSRWIPASAAVKPSSSVQVTVGAEAHPLPWLSLTSDVYARYTRNILLPRDEYQTKDGLVGPGIEVGTLLGQYVPGYGRAYGVELNAHLRKGAWESWLSYAGGRSLNRAPALGETAYRPARFDVPRSVRGVVQRNGERWDLTLAAELRSGYPHSVPVARYALGDPLDEEPPLYLHRPKINNGRLPPYFRMDVGVVRRFEWVGADWEAKLFLYNTTNRRNVISRQYDPSGEAVVVTDRRGLPVLPLFEIEMEL